jgi:hypothetical protein
VKSPAELAAEGLAKLDEFFAGRRHVDDVCWRPQAPIDPRPRCRRCDEPVEHEDAHFEQLGVMSPYPRTEVRCDPSVTRRYRDRLNAQARAAGKPEPFPARG